MNKDDFYVTEGNIFEDLGLPDSEELAARSDLLSEVSHLIRNSKLPQKEIAKILDITPSKVSMLTTGKLSAFSTDTLMYYLTLLGCTIEINVKVGGRISTSARKGKLTVRRKRVSQEKRTVSRPRHRSKK